MDQLKHLCKQEFKFDVTINCNSVVHTLSVTNKTIVKDIFTEIINKLDIKDHNLFGLFIIKNKNSKIWLNITKKLYSNYKHFNQWKTLYFGCIILPSELINGIKLINKVQEVSLNYIFDELMNDIYNVDTVDTLERLQQLLGLKYQIQNGEYSDLVGTIENKDIEFLFEWMKKDESDKNLKTTNGSIDDKFKSYLESIIIKNWILFSNYSRYDAICEFLSCLIGSNKFGLMIHDFTLENHKSEILNLLINPRGILIKGQRSLESYVNKCHKKLHKTLNHSDSVEEVYNTISKKNSKRVRIKNCHCLLITWRNLQELKVDEKLLTLKFIKDSNQMKLSLIAEDFVINEQINIFANIYISQTLIMSKMIMQGKTPESKFNTLRPIRNSQHNSLTLNKKITKHLTAKKSTVEDAFDKKQLILNGIIENNKIINETQDKDNNNSDSSDNLEKNYKNNDYKHGKSPDKVLNDIME